MRKLLSLFWEFFKISLFVIGGGYAIIAVAENIFSKKGWTKDGELIDQLPVFQCLPGLIATHTAVYVGNRIAGGLGALVGVAAVAVPAVTIFTAVACGYRSLPLDNPWIGSAFVGLRASLTGIIAATIVRSWMRAKKDVFYYALAFSGLVAIAVLDIAVGWVLLGAMVLGVMLEYGDFSLSRHRATWLPLLLFLKYGALGFGGGFVLVPMYMQDFVGETARWLQLPAAEFSDVMALTQMTPGPIGVNAATYFGYAFAGVPGAILASAALLLPGSLAAFWAFRSLERFKSSRLVRGIMRGVRPASLAMMACALWAFASMCMFSVRADGSWNWNPLAIALVILSMGVTMKKKLNVVVLIVVCALTAGVLRADDAVTRREFPDADTVVLNDIERVAYHPDGTYERTEEVWTRILTEKGRREESTIELTYSRRYAEAAIEYVGIIGADGQETEIDIRATLKESTDNSSMSANIYDPLDRRIACRVPSLKIGDTLHVRQRHRELKARCQNQWADVSVFEWTHPLLKATFEVVAPAERPLKNVAIRHPLGNLVTNVTCRVDGSCVHTFSVTNSPQAFPEPDMPPLYTQVQHVRVSTAEDWPEISRWYWGLCEPHLAKTTVAMTNKVEELLAPALKMSRQDKVRALFKFVSQEVRYMGLTLEDTSPGYTPHDVDITFDNRYGVCRDKAALLVALLRIAGLEAYPVLIHVGAKLDPQVPQPFFNHAVVAVANPCLGGESREKYLLMDPTDENTKDLFPSYLSDKSYLVCRPDGEDLRVSPVVDPSRNSTTIKAVGKLSKDGSLFLEHEIRMCGIDDTAYRHALVKMKPEDRVKFFERLMKRVQPGAELVKCEIEPKDMRDTERPIAIHLASKLPEMVLEGATRNELSVPFLSQHLGLANFMLAGDTSLVERKYPLKLDSTAHVRETLALDTAGVLGEVQTLPEAERGDREDFRYLRTFKVDGDLLTAERSVTLGAVEFDSAAYGELREELKRMEAADRLRPVFARDLLASADVRYLDCSTETTVLSDESWVTTNTVVKEVLTYQGKKNSAELKYAYNPLVSSIEVVSAVVSNRDGKVYSVTPREINVMDCSWAASAPRYLPSKLLVVNLPSVEIGSVISYRTVRRYEHAPVSYYGFFPFDMHEPLMRRHVRVNEWSRTVNNPVCVPNEPNQPAAEEWRDCVTISSNSFARAAARLRVATDVEPLPPGEEGVPEGLDGIGEIRNWLAKHVRLAGPSLYELPLTNQVTDVRTVLREGYGTRLDYIRTLCALLRGAGYAADIVFAADNADDSPAARERIKFRFPQVSAFSLAICRVTTHEGGWLGLGGTERTFYVGTENQYAPLGPTAFAGCDFFDPGTATFGVVEAGKPTDENFVEVTSEYVVRTDGAVDLRQEHLMWGPQIGSFRKTYSEILPENRFRRYQEILGEVAQAATATRELETDVVSYPARREFSCYVPDYALVQGDAISLRLPPLLSSLPSLTGVNRKTPFALSACDRQRETVIVRFPKGYVKIEHLPQNLQFADPLDLTREWMSSKISTVQTEEGLEVRLVREINYRPDCWFGAKFYELVKDWNRAAASLANRTITVRK